MTLPGSGDRTPVLALSRKSVVVAVDDDDEVLRALEKSLRNEPYTFVVTANPQQVIDWVDHGPVSLVISDLRMPLMAGPELLAQVRRRGPDTICVLLTAYTDAVVPPAGADQPIRWIFSKPWNDDDLRRTLRHLLLERDLKLKRRP